MTVQAKTRDGDPAVEVSVVIPVYNEEESLDHLHAELLPILESLGKSFEIVFVDDGSTDRSPEILRQFHEKDHRIRVILFTRNFGQQRANAAGLHYTRGRAIILMDADLQQPPQHIPEFLAKLNEGFDIVYGRRKQIRGPLLRRIGSRGASFLIRRLTGLNMKDCSSNFLALDYKLVRRINMFRDESRHLGSLFAWLSYGRCAEVIIEKRDRKYGESKYSLWKLVGVVLSLIFSLTPKPLMYITFAGALVLVFSGVLALRALWVAFAKGITSAETPLLIAALFLIGGLQLFSLGIVGEYIGRIYGEVRDRPHYVISEIHEDGEVKEP
jgi:glycosyltransferase involved in cell wall biosynthesis